MGLPQAEDESTCVRTFGEFEFAISGIGDCHSDSSGFTGSTFGGNLPLVRFLFTGNTAFGGDLPSVVVSACRLRRLPSVCGCFLQPPSAAFLRLWQPFFCRFPPVAAGHPPHPRGGPLSDWVRFLSGKLSYAHNYFSRRSRITITRAHPLLRERPFLIDR